MIRIALAAILWALPAAAAMDFNGSTDKADSGTAGIPSPPFSVCCWFKLDNITGQHGIYSFGDTAGNDNWWALQGAGFQAGDPVGATATETGPNQANAFTSTGYSAATWHHGCAVFTSDGSRTAYIDGGSAVTDSTAGVAPTSVDAAAIGIIKRASDAAFTDGSIAECGLWTSLALSAADAAMLAKGFTPPCVARQRAAGAIGNYYPMVRDSSALQDIFSAPDPLTLTGGTVSGHPRIINCQ